MGSGRRKKAGQEGKGNPSGLAAVPRLMALCSAEVLRCYTARLTCASGTCVWRVYLSISRATTESRNSGTCMLKVGWRCPRRLASSARAARQRGM